MLLSVQILRAAAALLVLAFHIQHELIHRFGVSDAPALSFGAAGVDIFFVVSGFIMVWSTRGLAGQPGAAGVFMGRRLVRIVPLYWLTTLVFLVGALLWPPAGFRGVDPALAVASFMFIPWPDQDGLHAPLYGLGWTLNHEMFFYVVFASCLAFAARKLVPALSTVLVTIVLLGQAVPDMPFVLKVWSNPIVLEFVAGAWIAVARINGVALSGWPRMAMIALGTALLVATAWLPGAGLEFRALIWGGPAALIMAGAVLGPEWPLRGPVARLFVLLGDASYSLYLVHFLVFSFVRRIGMRVFDLAAMSPVLYALVAALLAISASVAVHLLFERPLHRYLLARLGLAGRARAGLTSPAAGG